MTIRRGLAPVSAGLLLAVAVFAPARPQDEKTKLDQEYSAKVHPIVKKYCVSCHGGPSPTAGFSLEKGLTTATVTKNSKLYETLAFMVKSQAMPPNGAMPTDTER